jgi:hypothetical protein
MYGVAQKWLPQPTSRTSWVNTSFKREQSRSLLTLMAIPRSTCCSYFSLDGMFARLGMASGTCDTNLRIQSPIMQSAA